MERDTRRLGLLSVSLGIAIVTLLPVHSGLAQGIRPGMLPSLGQTFLGNLRVIDPLDIVQNILLFLPFGYFASATALRACALGAILSLGLEFLQLWIPGRYCSMLDVLLNAAGAYLGGRLAFAWRPETGKPIGGV